MVYIFRRHDQVWHIVRDRHQALLDASRGKVPRVDTFCPEQVVVADIQLSRRNPPRNGLRVYEDAVMAIGEAPPVNADTLEREGDGREPAAQGPICERCREQLRAAVVRGQVRRESLGPVMEAVLLADLPASVPFPAKVP